MNAMGYGSAALAVLLGAGLLWASQVRGQQATDDETQDYPQGIPTEMADGRRSMSGIHVNNDDNIRSLWMYKQGPATTGFQTFTADHEMDVHQIIISNGQWSGNRATSFGFYLSKPIVGTCFSASSGEFGTTSITFPIPYKLREGDSMYYGFQPVQGESLPGVVEVTFIGTVPNANIDSLSVH